MNIQQILEEELLALQADIIQAHKNAGQYTSGRTAASLSVETQDYSGQLIGASYVGVLDKGRKAGKVPYNMREIILEWADTKGLSFPTEADAQRFAYFVSKKIREEGTQLFREGGRTDVIQEPIERFKERLSKRIAGLYTQQTINHIFDKR